MSHPVRDERLPLRLALDRYPDDNEAWEHTDAWVTAPHRGRRRLPEDAGAVAYVTGGPILPRGQVIEAEWECRAEFSRAWRGSFSL
jgi:hypothetical protein